MSNCAVNLFPRKDCGKRSQTINIKCGEMYMVEGYCIPEDACVQFWKVDQDKCKCDHFEKPLCINGSQVGLDANCTTALLTMPGCYVAYMCDCTGDFDENFRIRAERIKCLDNLAVTLQGVALGA